LIALDRRTGGAFLMLVCALTRTYRCLCRKRGKRKRGTGAVCAARLTRCV